jgi:hypothetical protein
MWLRMQKRLNLESFEGVHEQVHTSLWQINALQNLGCCTYPVELVGANFGTRVVMLQHQPEVLVLFVDILNRLGQPALGNNQWSYHARKDWPVPDWQNEKFRGQKLVYGDNERFFVFGHGLYFNKKQGKNPFLPEGKRSFEAALAATGWIFRTSQRGAPAAPAEIYILSSSLFRQILAQAAAGFYIFLPIDFAGAPAGRIRLPYDKYFRAVPGAAEEDLQFSR